tara:strand:- start:676 stop:2808 length:2133 start_codon:yes stop_codon:yes gene_type:complete
LQKSIAITDDFLRSISPYFSVKINDSSYKKNLSLVKQGLLFGHSKNKIDNLIVKNKGDWIALNSEKPSVQWHFHTIGRGCGILLAKIRSFPEAKDILFSVVQLWLEANDHSSGFIGSEQAWAGHTVALRLDFLIALYLSLDGEQSSFLLTTINEHIAFLEKDENYDGNWNHGLDQSIALLKASFILDKKTGFQIAVNRILDNFKESFDKDGVNNEQAVMYHNYNIERYSYAQKLFELFGVEAPLFHEVLNKAKIFLLHAIDPNGYYSLLGDTIYSKPLFEHNSKEIDALLSQASKEDVSDTITSSKKAIYNAGYAFGRSSWNNRDNPSYYTLRFGPARIIHGHNDHTSITYFSNGHSVFSDGGFNGYGDDEYRSYFRNPSAHNVVYSPDDEKFNWAGETVLTSYSHNEHFDAYALVDKPYSNVNRARLVFFDLRHDLFVVFDIINSKQEMLFSQSWNLSPGSRIISCINNNVLLEVGGFKYNLLLDSAAKVECFKAFKSFESLKTNIVGGFLGLGHNHTEESFCIRASQKGQSIDWLTVFSPDKYDVKKVAHNFYLIDGKFGFQCASESEYIYFRKWVFDADVGYRALMADVSYKDKYSTHDLSFELISSTVEKKFFSIDLSCCVQDFSSSFAFVDIDIQILDGNAPTYYYLSGLDGKQRPNTGAFLDLSHEKAVLKLPVSGVSKFKVRFIVKEAYAVESFKISKEDICL